MDETNDAAQKSAHNLGQSSPWSAGFILLSMSCSAVVLSFPVLILDPLGWTAGIFCLLVGIVLAMYNSYLLSGVSVIDGVRYNRVRDIASKVLGPPAFWFTLIPQWSAIIFGSMGMVVLAADAYEGFYFYHFRVSDNHTFFQGVLVASAVLIVLVVLVPDLHNSRSLAVFAFCTNIFIIISTLAISIKDGLSSAPRNYASDLGHGYFNQISTVVSTLTIIAFVYNIPVLIEVQATVKEPPMANFRKSLVFYFCSAVPLTLSLFFVTYWAYGTNLAPIVLNNLSGPPWVVALCWLGVFIQMMVTFLFNVAIVYESIDSFVASPGGAWTLRNMVLRLVLRTPYVLVMALGAATIPVIGDIIGFVGSAATLPINFVLAVLLHILVNKKRMSTTSLILHVLLGTFYTMFTFVAIILSFRTLVLDAIEYNLFSTL